MAAQALGHEAGKGLDLVQAEHGLLLGHVPVREPERLLRDVGLQAVYERGAQKLQLRLIQAGEPVVEAAVVEVAAQALLLGGRSRRG